MPRPAARKGGRAGRTGMASTMSHHAKERFPVVVYLVADLQDTFRRYLPPQS